MALLAAGAKAPDFEVNNQDGKLVRLKDFRGKKLVLYFYPQDLTETCTKQACNLRDNYKTLTNQGYEILGVSADNEKSHQRFIKKEHLPFQLLADTDKKMHEAYGTWGEKFKFGRHYMGTLRVTYIINEKGIIERVIEQVKSAEHSAQILGEPIETTTSPKVKTASKKSTAKTTSDKTQKPAKKNLPKATTKKKK